MYQITHIILLLFLNLNMSFYCNPSVNKNQKKINKADTIKQKQINEKQKKVLFNKIANIPVPAGYERIKLAGLSFGWYLRNLPLNTTDNKVYAYNGSVIMGENGYQYAVIDMDIGKRDLQQCADAIMRLRAEYFYQQKKYSEIHFNFLSDGKARYYTNYSKSDRTYSKFRKYMDYIFAYANTGSLKKELKKVTKLEDIQIGDVFIQTGQPYGHAVIVVDVAKNKQSGKKIFMLAQSFMPAQSIHILKNYNTELNPWYSVDFGEVLELPSWTFSPSDLRRF